MLRLCSDADRLSNSSRGFTLGSRAQYGPLHEDHGRWDGDAGLLEGHVSRSRGSAAVSGRAGGRRSGRGLICHLPPGPHPLRAQHGHVLPDAPFVLLVPLDVDT